MIIKDHNRKYKHERSRYDVELANFIKNKYESFCEKRWKYIIEYNKMERTKQKDKKVKELRRLLELVGMQRLMDEDCIP